MKTDISGIKIDDVNMDEALVLVEKWIWNKPAYRTGKPFDTTQGKHYVVTPNLEFILAAQKDQEFKDILNRADLAIPDSSSLGFSYWLLKKNRLTRLLLWPLFFLPFKQVIPFERVLGIDLMEALCKLSAEKGFVVGFLGGAKGVAEKCAECLLKKYPNLKISFASGDIEVNKQGREVESSNKNQELSKKKLDSKFLILPSDILFVAFGHIKQEKWIADNLDKIPIHVAMGVGGAFDYLSGSVPRAPKWIRDLGFEWLFRLFVQPRRIKRQFSLLKYLYLLWYGKD